jgi:hypothetical protein
MKHNNSLLVLYDKSFKKLFFYKHALVGNESLRKPWNSIQMLTEVQWLFGFKFSLFKTKMVPLREIKLILLKSTNNERKYK